MKKTYAVIAFLLIAVLLTGCTEPAAVPHDVNQAAHYDAHGVIHEELRDGTTAPAARAAEQTSPSAAAQGEPALSSARFFLLDRSEAKAIALQQAGVSADAISHYAIALAYDDDRHYWEYEVSFRVGAVEYDIEMNAESGAVLDIEKERDDR